jgi:transcription antitermination factor NusG
MSEHLSNPWLVLRTKSRHENKVESHLQQKQITVYLPRQRLVRRSKGRKTVVERPLFPGYVFVQPRLEQFEKIRYIRGSCGFVFAGAKPATMQESDLDAVRVLVNSGATLSVATELVPGRRVRVISGPFAGACGELVRVKSHERFVINAQALNSSVSVEVTEDMIAAM